MLVQYGFFCDCAANVLDAIELHEQNSYDFVFLDYYMPAYDGSYFLENITQSESTKYVTVTAGYIADIKEKVTTDFYLHKPILLRELKEIINDEFDYKSS